MAITPPPSYTAAPEPHPVRNDRATFSDRVDAFVTWFIGAIDDVAALCANTFNNANEAYTLAQTASTKAGEAAGSAATAQSSAQTAVNAPGTNATSATSDTIATGSTTITIQTGKSIVVGMTVKMASTASPTNWMHGDVTAYNSGTGSLTVNVSAISGSGTFAAWTVSLSAPGTQLPAQTGNAGKFLTTNGTSTAWADTNPFSSTTALAQVQAAALCF